MECLPSPWPRKGTGLLPAPVKVRQFSVSGVCSAPFSLPESKQYSPLPSCSLGRGLYCFVFMWRLGKNGGGGGEDINYGSTVWAAPVPLPCSRSLYLPCVIPQRLYAAWCRQVGQEDSKTKKPRKTMKIRRGPKMQYILLFFDNYS